MTEPRTEHFFNAIITNSTSVVKSYLQDGADPNENLVAAVPLLSSFQRQNQENQIVSVFVPENIKLVKAENSSYIFPLHVALLNCFHSINSNSGPASREDNGMEILNLLLQYGADPKLECFSEVCVTNIAPYTIKTIPSFCAPVEFAVFLKAHCLPRFKEECFRALDKAISAMSAITIHSEVPRRLVPLSTLEGWKSMCLSDTFSDITFVCPDGTTLPAHRAVLAATSHYFSAALTGEWKESNSNGVWTTSHDSNTLKQVLEYMYSGSIDCEIVDDERLKMLAIADEFVLEPLKAMAEQSCIVHLTVDTVKEMLIAAGLYSARALKDACHVMVKRNAFSLIVDPAFMELNWTHPELWKELGTFLAPDVEQHDIRPTKRENDPPEEDRPTKRSKTGVMGWLFDRSDRE